MLDIIFISYDEPNADKNFAALKARFPHARRVHGVKGIANAHIAASKKALTKFFYVVDADATIHPTFDFSYKPKEGDENYVHVWYAMNPALGISYGYGGVKLFNKAFFKNVQSQLDFTTTLTKDIKVIPQTVCTTHFNSDHYRSARGAFREAAKLWRTTQDPIKPKFVRMEAEDRLKRWLNPIPCDFSDIIRQAAELGVKEAEKNADLMFINDHDFMLKLLGDLIEAPSTDPTIDPIKDPTPAPDHPMKQEFFFTTRIASALYDPYVLGNLPLTEIRDAISDGQILSKMWLAERLQSMLDEGVLEKGSRVAILGGWIGTLTLMLHCKELSLKVTSIDLDPRANRIAEKLNYDYEGFGTMTMDMYQLDYSQFDVIINTSSEHIPNIPAWREKIPAGKLIIVQNNNYLQGEGHVSCVNNSHELRKALNLSEVLYEGTRTFIQYDRYMLVGRT
jgi:hypothetical protein